MALEIQEYVGGSFSAELVEDDHLLNSMNLTEDDHDNIPIAPNSLMVDVEGIHAFPHATRNFTRYMPKCLKNSVPTWTHPYNRPLIKHHNEKNGKIIGRILNAEYKTKGTFSNTPALLFTVNVPGEDAKEDILNGTESTVSIGVIAHDVRCRILSIRPVVASSLLVENPADTNAVLNMMARHATGISIAWKPKN